MRDRERNRRLHPVVRRPRPHIREVIRRRHEDDLDSVHRMGRTARHLGRATALLRLAEWALGPSPGFRHSHQDRELQADPFPRHRTNVRHSSGLGRHSLLRRERLRLASRDSGTLDGLRRLLGDLQHADVQPRLPQGGHIRQARDDHRQGLDQAGRSVCGQGLVAALDGQEALDNRNLEVDVDRRQPSRCGPARCAGRPTSA